MTSRKQLAINQRALYDDAVKNKMFWNATPSFQEFQRRLQNPKYVQTVQANYRAHGRSGDAFDTLSGFRDYFCVSDEDKQDMTQGVGNMIADTKARLAGQQRYNKLKQHQDKQRGRYGRLDLGVKNPLTNDNVVREPLTGRYLTSDGAEYAQEYEAARAQNHIDETGKRYTEAVERGDLPSAFEVQDENGNYALMEDLGVKPGVHVTEKGKQQQLAGLVNTRKNVEEQYNALYRKLEEDFKRSAPFSINTHSQYGIDDNNMRLQAYLNSNAQYRRLKAQLHQLDNAIGVGKEAVKGRAEERYVKNAKGMLGYAYRDLKSFGASALRGLWNAVSDVSTWDLGLQDLQDNMTLYTTVKKARQKGYENLNSEERQMLDVAAKTGAYTAENQQYLGRGYKAGNVTGESLPFMVEMALNPASGLGEAVMSKYMRNAIAKYGKEAVRKEAWKYVTKKCGYRVAGDVLGAALMTGTTGSARTLADTYDRLTGDIKSTYDSNGKIVYDGTENEEKGILKAYLKAFGANAIENHSEFVGEYFNPLLKGVGTLTMKGWKKVNAKSANAFLDNLKDMGSTSTAKWLGNLFDKTQWHGTIGEYAEEVVGNIENALLVGDSTLDTKEGTGVFNLDQNIDTFLGVSLMGGFFSTLKTGAYVRDKVKGERKILMQQSLDLDNSIRYALGADPKLSDKWKEWRVALAQGTDEEKKQALKEISENTNGYIKKAMYDYSANAQKIAGMDKATQGAVEDGTITPEQAQRDADIEQAHEEGLAAEGTARHDIQQEHQLKENSLARMLGISAEQLDRMEDEDIESMTGQNDALDTAIYDYQTSRERYQGVIDRATDEVEQAGIDAAHQIDLYTDHSTSQIRPCVIKGNNGKEDYQGYIVNGNVATHPDGAIDVSGSDKMILYFDPETGKIEHGDASAFASLGESADATVARQQAIDEAKQQAAQAQSRDIDGGVGEDGNVSEAMPTFPQSSDQEERNAADFDIGQVVNAETGEVIPVSFEGLAEGENAYLTGGRPDGKTKDRLKVTIVDAEGNVTNRVMKRGNVQVDGRMSAEDFRNAYEEAVSSRMAPEADMNGQENNVNEEGVVAGDAAPSADTAATSGEEGAASEPAVRDKNGNPIYDKMPISATIADLYDGALDDAEIDGFVSAQIAEAEKAVEKMEKKKPKVGTDKAKYLADKKAWEEGLQEAQRKVQYWQDVKSEVEKITTPEDARGYEEELNGDAAQTAYRNGSDAAAYGAREVTAEFMQSGDVKITPESYRKETGFGAAEQRAMVGKISKGGKSIDRLAEDLEVFDRENYNGMYFGGDSSVAKDAILDYLSSPDSRKGVKKMQSEAEREYVEAYEAERDRYYQEKYHMSYEEYLVYSSQEMPELLRKYSNFDEQLFLERYADEIEAALQKREEQLKQEENGKEGNVSAGEESGHGRSNQVQSGERTDDTGRGEVGKDSAGEVGSRHEGVVESEAASKETITPEQQSLLSNKQSSGQAKMSHKEKTGEKEAMSPTPAMIDRMIEEQRVDDVSELLISSELKKAAEGIAEAFGMKVVYLKKVFIKSDDPAVEDFEGNGFVRNGVIYLSLKEADIAQFTFGHELLHQLKQIDADSYMRIRQKVIDVMGRKAFEMEVKARQMTYANVPGYTLYEDYAEEVIADTLGDIITHTDMLPNIARSLKDNPSLLDRFLNVVDNVRQYFRGKTGGALGDLVNDIRDTYEMTARQGAETNQMEAALNAVNDRFNDRLESLVANPNQKDKVLRLGRSSEFLRNGGLADAEIVLEFDKLARKSKEGYKNEHPFDMSDIKDLPKAIASPIAVFGNTSGENDGNVILTELKKDGKNFIVAVKTVMQPRKGGVVLEVNQITSLFPKDAKGIVHWFNSGKATNIDKEKALRFIEALPNHPGTTIKAEELISAANVVKDFVNSKESEEKDRQRYASIGVSMSLGEDAAEGEPRWASWSLSEPRGEDAAEGEREATSVRLQRADIVDAEAMAEEYGLDADDVRRYAEGMLSGNLALANQAFASIRVAKRRSMVRTKLSEFAKIFSPIEKELYERFGNINELREEYVRRVEEERSLMEAARKRAEEEQRKREVRLEELAVLTDEEIDHSYAEALAKGDVAAAREMLDEAARRKGYGDVRSDYQGVGAWSAPSNPDYETDEARRNAVGEDSPDLNVEDMAAGYSNQPEDIFVHPNKYSQGLPTSKESGNAIQTAIDDIRNGKKDVTVKVYRAVPTSVKEGKLRNGDWVTPSRKYAELHGSSRLEGKYRIIEDEVPVSELWWDGNDVNEWGYDNGKGYRYKNVKNNRKLNDLVTRDDNGNVIPPSKRFNQRKADERYQRGVGGVKPSKAEAVLRDAVIDRLRENGMEVITDVAEGQKVLDEANGEDVMLSAKQKRALETVTIADESTNNATAISSADGAKVQNNLEILADNYEKRPNKTKGFITDLSQALNLEQHEASHYGTFETRNGKLVTIRVSNHNARVSFFDENGEEDGISIVISSHKNKGVLNDGKAHLVEYFYPKQSLERSGSKPLADIVKCVSNALDSGKFDDTTGIAQPQEVNVKKIREQRVYHGSGADFEAFDHSHMGEGQGSQVFGWGTYVTSSKAIGESYAESSSRTGGMEYTGDALTADEASLVGSLFISGMSSYHEVEEFLEKSANSDKPGAKRSAKVLALLRKTKPEEWKLPQQGKGQLYTVEIPEDNGSNYLDWENPLNDAQKEILKEGLMAAGVSVEFFKRLGFTLDSSFKYVYSASLPMMLRGVHVGKADNVKEKVSRFLSGLGFTGIKYPAGTIHGGAEKGDMNYVIFNEKDAKITDHVRFFRTANGEAYGFTVGGRIYVDPRIATSETPVHEYAHLWATALRSGNAEEWQNVVGLMKDSKVWDEVKERYPELKSDDEIADEVIATYSGRRGAERLREEQRKIAEGDGGVFEKAEAISALEKVKRALKMFWKGVADFLHIHYKSAEEVADRVMKDLLEGVDPRKMGETKDGGVRFNAKQKRALETASLGNAPRSLTVVSSATGAKILNSIDKLVESLEKSATQPKTFIGNVAKALGASRFGSGSEYATFETKNGDIVTIRLANHNAHVSGFDHNGKDNGISIVISPKPNEGITNDGNAHITEFYYDSIKLRRADGKPLAEIVRSIKQALYSGDFKDTTGLAERQEVNGEDVIRYQFIGEKGAAEADHAEEVSVRLDNLSVAREMEDAGRDAKAVKMATGWERGADGKWRYEIADLKEFDRNGNLLYRKHHPDYARYIELQDKDLKNLLEDGEKLTDKEREEYEALSKKYESDKFGGEKLDNIHTLEAYVDAPELFKAYPELRNVRVTFKDTGGWEIASYYATSDVIDFNVDDVGEIVVNTGKVTANMRTKELKSVFLHEIQHAIQVIEGFAEGGSPQYMKGLYSDYFLQDYSSSQLHELAELRRIAEGKVKRGEYKRMSYAVKNVIKAAKEHGFYPTWAESFDNNPNSVTTVYDTLVKFPSEILDKAVLIDEIDLYNRVAGEVEARNVQERMGMSAEERRASLAAETEDVAREDQIFLMGDGVSEMGSRVGKRMAEIGEHYEDRALTDEERPIVDVFCGRNDNLKISIERDGKSLVLMMRQGSENGAGTKHCLYRHYGTGVGYLTADDILKIPYIMANGFAKEKLRGKSRLVEYTYKDEHGCEYTLLTEKKKGFEIFNDFYTNRKASSLSTFNTSEDAHTGSDNALMGAKLGNVSETAKESEGKDRQRWASSSLSEQQLDGDDTIRFSLRQEPAPKVTKKGYAVFIYKKLKNGGYKLVPKMLSNDPGAPAQTWLNADTGYMKRDENGEPLQNTNGRASVSVNGSQAGGNKSNKLAWRPGKHLAMYPNASQFKSPDGTIPKDVIFFEVEYAADPDLHKQYQRNAWELGMNDNGQYRNNQGGLPYISKDSYYLYRTNSISEGATPMIITGAYKINRALTDAEAKELNQNAGGMWCPRKGGDLTEEKLKDMGLDDKGLKKMTESFDMDTIKESHDESDEARLLPGYKSREINWEDKDLIHSIEENGQDINDYRDGYVAPEHSEEPTIRFSLNYDKWNSEMASWLKRNRLPKNAQRPVVPQREIGESDLHFAGRLAKYNQDKALWNTAPKYEGHLSSGMTARGEFNYELQRGSVLTRIAVQDSMLAIRKAQEAIARHSGLLKVGTFEDAYMAENNSHGKAKNEFEQYDQEYLEPLRKWFSVMMKRLDGSYNNVTNYMIAKHGLERNAHMAFMAALEAEAKKAIGNTQPDAKRLRAQMVHDAYRQYKADSRRLINDADYEAGKYDYAQWRRTDDAIRKSYCSNYESFRYDKGGVVRDYAGLSSLFQNETDFEEKAAELCADIESKNGHETSELWDAVRQATRQILKNSHDAGMMSDETYDYVRGMYEHYIPLRGWNDSSADEVWDYAGGGRGVFNAALKEAHGRQSLADDPVAYIMNMAESGFLVNNRNWVKQHFLTMAMNHPTDLLTVSKAWYVKTKDQFGNEVWIPASPNIPVEETDPAVIQAALDAFQTKMEQMEQSGDATQQRGSLNIEYPQTKSEEREHEVRVMKDGEEYVIYVNGDPQLAQALNNTRAMRVREHEGLFEKACAWLGRKMAAVYTSLSPLFVPSNWARDTTMTLASTAIREDARYNWLLRTKFMRPDVQMRMFGLVKEYQNGKLREKVKSNKATKIEENFWNFMINGGETGFVSTMDVDAFREKIQRDLKDMGRTRLNPVKVGHIIADSVEYINRVIEDSNRFAIYQTSIEYGRGIEEAVQDAKNVTLNFNRKGTGEMGMSAIRQLFLFINPAIQSLQTLGALAKEHKAKFTAVTSAWMASGMLVPLFNELMFNLASAAAGGGGDDDDEFNPKEEYWKFSSFDRRNNCILWIPFTHNFIKIPLAPEFRGFYGIGDMVASAMWGGENAKESWSNYAADLMGQIIDLSPLDPVSYDGNVLVSLMPNAIRPLVEIAQNVTFTGKPIYRESDFNKYDPSFKKAYAGTPDFLLRYSKWMNSIGNKYPEAQQGPVEQTAVGRYANNPAVIDHLLKSYLGGMYTLGSQIAGAITKASDEETRKDFKTADIPFFSKFVANPNDRPQSKNKGDAYWQDFEKYQRTSHTLGVIRQDARKTGNFSVLEDFYKSEEYKEMKEYEPKAKQRKEEQKYEKWKEEGNADLYQPHQQTGEDVYKRHSTPADDFEDTKASILYQKIKPAKDIFDLADINTPSGMDTFNKYYDLAGKVEEAQSVKKEMNAIVKSFVNDEHKATFDPEKMKEYRALRKQYVQLVEEGNRMFEKIKAQRN